MNVDGMFVNTSDEQEADKTIAKLMAQRDDMAKQRDNACKDAASFAESARLWQGQHERVLAEVDLLKKERPDLFLQINRLRAELDSKAKSLDLSTMFNSQIEHLGNRLNSVEDSCASLVKYDKEARKAWLRLEKRIKALEAGK